MKNTIWLVALVMFGLSLGVWRGGIAWQDYSQYDQFFNKKTKLIVTAKSDAAYNDQKQLEFEAADVRVQDSGLELPGRITVSGYGELSINRGEVLRVDGKIFKARGGKVARIGYADIEKIGLSNSLVDKVKKHFVAGIYTALPDPAASFALGVLIGQRTTLPDYVSDDFRATGLTHIIAVSGYNLTILVLFARRAFGKFSKYQSTLLAGLMIVGFVLITGFSAAIVRAAIVSGLSLAAWYVGRSVKPLLLIGITVAATGLANPLYVWFDIGWYLSFLAFTGILILSPLLAKRYVKRSQFATFKQLVFDTFSAQIMTLPLILYVFGKTSVLGFIANLVVVPMVPFAMFASFIAGLAGVFGPVYAGIFAWPAKVVLVTILDIAHWFAKIPGATVSSKINLVSMLILYGVMIGIIIILHLKTQYVRGIIDLDKE